MGRPRKTAVTNNDEKLSKAAPAAGNEEEKIEVAAETPAPKKRGRKPGTKKLEATAVETKIAETVEKPVKKVTRAAKKAAKEVVKETKEVVTRAKKAAKSVEASVIVQHAGRDIDPKKLLDDAKAAWLAKGNKESAFKSIGIYINVDENKYYPVINGEEQGGFEIS